VGSVGEEVDKAYIKQNNYENRVVNAMNATSRYHDRYAQNFKKFTNLEDEYGRLMANISTNMSPEAFSDWSLEFSKLRKDFREVGGEAEKFGEIFRAAFQGQVVAQIWSAGFSMIRDGIDNLYNQMDELDAKLVDLQIATGMTRAQSGELLKSYADLGREIGITTKQTAESADAWLRQGKSIAETNELIKASAALSVLGQITAGDATQSLTSMINGYNLASDAAMELTDKLTALDAAYAVTAGGIATGVSLVSSLAAGMGVPLENLMGMFTVMQNTTQQSEAVIGNALKRIMTRMSNVKEGRLIDPNDPAALNTVEKTLNGMGIALREMDGKKFRDVVDVLDDAAQKWKELRALNGGEGEFEQLSSEMAAMTTAFGGAHAANTFAALMNNWDEYKNATEIAMDAAGSAEEKYEAHLNSLAGAHARLEASTEKLSMSLFDTDAVRDGVNALSDLVAVLADVVEWLGSANTAAAVLGAGLTLFGKGPFKEFDLLNKRFDNIFTTRFTGGSVSRAGQYVNAADTKAVKEFFDTWTSGEVTLADVRRELLQIGDAARNAVVGLENFAEGFRPLYTGLENLKDTTAQMNTLKTSINGFSKGFFSGIAPTDSGKALRAALPDLENAVRTYQDLTAYKPVDGIFSAQDIAPLEKLIATATGAKAALGDLKMAKGIDLAPYDGIGEKLRAGGDEAAKLPAQFRSAQVSAVAFTAQVNGASFAMKALSVASKLLGAAVKMALNVGIMLAVSVAIERIVKLVDKWIETTEELTEKQKGEC
jgi:TP901 family phage tail tape measure protein